ncbi:MAG: hypothetical protein JW919_01570 [Candidatus Omnitrophica bacterium]|nr:hypothetical protein [Candidatus Omnitrophota bacterium]
MRHIFKVGLILEKRVEGFYVELAEKVLDPKAKDLCRKLARIAFHHAQLIEKTLSEWRILFFDRESLDFFEGELKRRNIFLDPPLADSSEEDIVKYAIGQEWKKIDFYRAFEDFFTDSWRRMHVKQLVMEERSCIKELVAAYPDIRT